MKESNVEKLIEKIKTFLTGLFAIGAILGTIGSVMFALLILWGKSGLDKYKLDKWLPIFVVGGFFCWVGYWVMTRIFGADTSYREK